MFFYLAQDYSRFDVAGSAYIPDALWAYAFCSALLIVWDRRKPVGWLCVAAGSAMIYELLQHIHLVGGTGDLFDIATYIIAGCAALLCNNYFVTYFQYKPNQSSAKTTS